jgi:type I restriction enzyme, S subunit
MAVDLAPLADLVEDILDRRGVTPTKLGSKFCDSGHRVISAKLMKGHRLDLMADEARYVDSATYRRWMATPIRADDVLLTSEAPLGEVAYVESDIDWCLGQRLFCIRTDKRRLHGRYLFYCLRGEPSRTDLLARATGTTVQGIRQSELRRVVIPVRSLPEQKRIAHILGTLDDRIDLNRRMSATLEAMSRAIFKSWFVDFDPVRQKAAGKQPVGMDSQTAALFPDSFEDSEIGEVPIGWEVVPLPKAIEVNPARPLKKGETALYLDMANMPTNGHTPDELITRPFGSGTRFTNGDTLVARITPCLENGKTAFIDCLQAGEIAWGSTEFIVLRPHPPLPPEFAYCLARDDGFREFAIKSMTGSSGRQRVPAESLDYFRLARPPAELAGGVCGPRSETFSSD